MNYLVNNARRTQNLNFIRSAHFIKTVIFILFLKLHEFHSFHSPHLFRVIFDSVPTQNVRKK